MTEHGFVHQHADMPPRDLRSTAPPPSRNGAATPVSAASRRRQRVTVFLPAPLLERLRNAVYWTERRPLAQIIADAVEDAVTELEHANGGAFPTRLAPLKPGRPRRNRTPARRPPKLLTTNGT